MKGKQGSRSFRQNLGEYSVNNPESKSMVSISHKVFFVNKEIMIRIQLPELAVYDIEMLIWEVPSCQCVKWQNEVKQNHIYNNSTNSVFFFSVPQHFVDVFFLISMNHCINQVSSSELPKSKSPISGSIYVVEYSVGDSFSWPRKIYKKWDKIE